MYSQSTFSSHGNDRMFGLLADFFLSSSCFKSSQTINDFLLFAFSSPFHFCSPRSLQTEIAIRFFHSSGKKLFLLFSFLRSPTHFGNIRNAVYALSRMHVWYTALFDIHFACRYLHAFILISSMAQGPTIATDGKLLIVEFGFIVSCQSGVISYFFSLSVENPFRFIQNRQFCATTT